ncbi:MAG: LCP family protein [Anaerovoracaceae bacterium]|nr:LCP family protein [Bacillota bacterium]MDY5770260.1 LCP family protein [Anaerovoracaceae bacterium]
MRSDRRREIQAQMEEDRKGEMKRKGNIFCRTISIIYTVLAAAFIALLAWLNVLPAKYFWAGVILLALASLFIVPVMYSRRGKKGRKIGATVVAFLLIGVFGVGTYYLADTIDFLGEITSIREVTEDYHVIVKADAIYEDVSGLAGQTLGTYMDNDLNYSEAKAMLQEKVDVEYAYEENVGTALEKLYSGDYPAILISAASYEVLKGENSALETETKILYTIKVPVETGDHTNAVNVTKEPFNVYISGIDVEGDISTVSRSDVNMIATVNPVTHRVLLTSIPRDYYITLPSKNAKDKLTHSGLYGVQETIGAVEGIMGIDINYYVRVNYTTVVKLVDAIGGIEVDSPYDFTTSGMQSLNGHHFVKGINHLDGRAALAFCRERHSFVNGDMQRNENQQLVMEGILKKATSSTTILTSYTSILDAVKGNMETNMSTDEMSSLIKMQLNGMPGWDIEKQAIKGTNSSGYCYALGFPASIVDQDPEENARAVDEIVKVMTDDGKEEQNDEE